ncbi:hypothetical protein [Tenacibaculum piscium]|uniref:hypothetical protein n=1 Tax=Tenacibaculum piscium TaxID=1458515 RepID=UPI001F422762|nr:hypothetical protein [Tenacibaculum piscium]MCG8184430.1 hypothetical protein [Tenacibaculum piscium]MCG8205832.1 hypothetical protein [Tenacibaculum piscium]
MKKIILLFLTLSTIVLTSCDSNDNENTNPLTGTWVNEKIIYKENGDIVAIENLSEVTCRKPELIISENYVQLFFYSENEEEYCELETNRNKKINSRINDKTIELLYKGNTIETYKIVKLSSEELITKIEKINDTGRVKTDEYYYTRK